MDDKDPAKIHDHSEQVENSRSSANSEHRSKTDLRAVKSGRLSTPLDDYRTPSTVPDQDVPVDIPKKSPLPPISKNVEKEVLSSESEVDIKFCDETTNENEASVAEEVGKKERKLRKRPPKVLKAYRSEDFGNDGYRNSSSQASTVSLHRPKGEKQIRKGSDGKEKIVVTIECQTEWSWLEDMKRLQALSEKQSRYTSGHEADGDIDSESDEDNEDINVKKRATFDQKTLEKSASPSKTSAISGDKTSVLTTDQSSIQMAPSLRDDDYGIPILQLSSDTSSDEESITDVMQESNASEAQDGLGTLPSIGPPQILQYNRESEKKELNVDNPDTLDPDLIAKLGDAMSSNANKMMYLNEGGIFEGSCEFCGNIIKKFPTLEEQKNLQPEVLYCCDEYREFVQFMVSHPLHEKFNADRLIDVGPHAPYGSKQARKAAKERAAIRSTSEEELRRLELKIRQRERRRNAMSKIARQMKTINFCLSSQKCYEDGWTVRPPTPMMEDGQDMEIFEAQPVVPLWANPQETRRDKGLVRKYYADNSKFLILFPDGSGNVFYPSGRVALSIIYHDPGHFTYIVSGDSEENSKILALFEYNGSATTYFPTGSIRICLDQFGGVELDAHGTRKRKWSWKDQVQHVHAPPIQPITFAVSANVSVRIMSQSNITLTFTMAKRSAKFQVGSVLKCVAPNYVLEPEIDDDQLFRETVTNRIHELLQRVNNLLKFPKSPKIDKLSNPQHIVSKQQKIEKTRNLLRERTVVKESKKSAPVVIVN